MKMRCAECGHFPCRCRAIAAAVEKKNALQQKLSISPVGQDQDKKPKAAELLAAANLAEQTWRDYL